MVLFGTIVNGICIIVGSTLGLFLSKIPERVKETVMHSIGLAVLLIGMQMAFATQSIIVVLLSMLIGSVVGEFIRLEESLNNAGDWFATRFARSASESGMSFSQGFVTATLIFCVGAMAIIGPLDSGIRGDHEVLLTKSVLDGFTALVLTTTLGSGVLFAFIPVLLYQGTLTLIATQVERWVPQDVLNGLIAEVTSVGGLIILAIGLNMLKITKIRVGNLIPSLVLVGLVYYVYHLIY
ncbi:DUF554 domain-containing protein [Lentibacillus saliphilus]|uniref:DUF554 domain-containing protein n=1 Tax=Lentibacillus saliphilus TaxID=2737028 RepID=UPI001C3020CC|nr:DUF554 domain-containing protein [Lentibacillus saliphilus]